MLTGKQVGAMMPKTLPHDATLASVLPTLDKKIDYICGVLEHLYQCRAKRGNAEVLIGITGKGLRPCYRIQYSDQAGISRVFDTFADNHVSLSAEGQPIEGGDSWSTKAMSLIDVATLRGTLKG
jgi:hypothetical protein